MDKMRIQKFLSDVGLCSRSQAEKFIRAGRIVVNGQKAQLGDKVSPQDSIVLDGRKIQVRKPPRKKIVVLNKPKGVESVLSPDPWGKTLLDIDFGPDRVFPIGRLDKESHGLLLLTNDGELGNRLAHPCKEREEEYRLVVREIPSAAVLSQLERVVLRDDKRSTPYRVERIKDNVLKMVLHHGRSKHVRRICEAVGVQIEDLQRVRVGTISLGGLKTGRWRVLDDQEYRALKKGDMPRRGRRRIVPVQR